jgi:hypothetical protein
MAHKMHMYDAPQRSLWWQLCHPSESKEIRWSNEWNERTWPKDVYSQSEMEEQMEKTSTRVVVNRPNMDKQTFILDPGDTFNCDYNFEQTINGKYSKVTVGHVLVEAGDNTAPPRKLRDGIIHIGCVGTLNYRAAIENGRVAYISSCPVSGGYRETLYPTNEPAQMDSTVFAIYCALEAVLGWMTL